MSALPVEVPRPDARGRPARGLGAPAVAVVLHDVAPATQAACERLRRRVASIAALPVTWLVVPRYHGQPSDGAFETVLEAALDAGDELALHGYTHRDPGRPRGWQAYALRRCYTAGEGEFAALSREEAGRRIEAGLRWFRCRGWPLQGFVAPAWLLSAGSWQALEASGLAYTCTLGSVVSLQPRALLRSPSFVYSTRSGWRRALSLAWVAALARSQRATPLLRLELHPADADYPAIRRSWTRLLERALHDGREPLTLAQAARRAAAAAVVDPSSPGNADGALRG